MSDKKVRHTISDLTGGRNGYDPPWAIAKNQCADAVNVDWYKTTLANKRSGLVTSTVSGMTMLGRIASAFRHVPGTNERSAELWAVDDYFLGSIVNRLAGSTVWSAPTMKDAPSLVVSDGASNVGFKFDFATINAKLSIAYPNAVNRHHFWDRSTVRRSGLPAPVAPTSADTGSGASITFDAAATLNFGAPTTFTHTCAVGAGILWVFTRTTSGFANAVTYNGVAMTVYSQLNVTPSGWVQAWYLLAPASGAHTVAITVATNVCAVSSSYIGALTTSGPEAQNQVLSTSATVAASVVTVSDSDWCIYGVANDTAAPTAGTNSTVRGTPVPGAFAVFDSNTRVTPAQTFTMTVAVGAGTNSGGIIAAFAPSSGVYAAVLRYYRVRWTRQASGITVGRSEPGTSVAFTPVGTGSAARITQPAVANEGETHWEVEASLDNTTFYRIATIAIATTTYDDAAATTSYNTNPLSALTGVYTLQKNYKYVAADQNRHLGWGSWNPADKQSRLEISAVIGSLDISDEERIDTTTNYFLDFDENDSGAPTGLEGPILESYIVFKQRQIAQLTATGSPSQPYRQGFISKVIGATNNEAIARGEDRIGNPALYFMSYMGPYRWGLKGLEYLGHNHEDYFRGPNATINPNASRRAAVTLYYQPKQQVWWWWATGTSAEPNQGAIYDVKTGGWSRIPSTDLWSNVLCAILFANTISDVSTDGGVMSADLKPYIGQAGAAQRLYKADTGTIDITTPYQAYVVTRAEDPGGNGFSGEVTDSILVAKAAQGVTITDTLIVDFGQQSPRAVSMDISPQALETRVSPRMEGGGLSGITTVQHQLGDAVAVSNAWTLEQLITGWKQHGADSQ